MSLQTGQIIDGKYRIIREIGSGAMGAVYEGENLRIKRRVAIKVLLPSVADRGDVVERFEREAQAAGRIGSDHIVEVLDLGGLPDGGFYMVMEFLEGETLGARIKQRGRLDGRAIAPIAQQLLMGLEMAHDAQIIHRDLKPENVFLCREHAGQKDFVKILDFGVSKFNPLNDDDAMSMTRTGTVVGTPFYMAPEQAKGARDIDKRSDLYSVGVILFEAVTGQVPFHAGTFNELIFKIVLEPPPPPEKFAPDMDPGFGRIVRKAMGREPDERYQTAAEFRDALYVWLHTGRDTKEPRQLRPPPIGSNVDWGEEQQTLLLDGDDPSNNTTRVMDGGGTAIMDPSEGATTRVMDPDDDQNAKTSSRTPPSPKRPPPPPRSQRAPTQQRAQSSPARTAQLQAPPPPPPTGGGLGVGAPTPINRRPMAADDWPTGVPRKRSVVVPFLVGGALVLGVAGAAAALVVPWSSPAATTEVADAEETRATDDDEQDGSGGLGAADGPAPAPQSIAHDPVDDTKASDDTQAPDDTKSPDGTQSPDGTRATSAPPPSPTSAPEPPAPAPAPPPAASPKPSVPSPRPRPSPAAAPPPPTPPPPAPPSGGRKVETTL